jgi:hypothetical protein
MLAPTVPAWIGAGGGIGPAAFNRAGVTLEGGPGDGVPGGAGDAGIEGGGGIGGTYAGAAGGGGAAVAGPGATVALRVRGDAEADPGGCMMDGMFGPSGDGA